MPQSSVRPGKPGTGFLRKWVTAGDDFGEGFQETLGSGNWYVLSFDHAFQLTGPGGVVPEPASLLLVGLGMAGLAHRVIRQSV